MATLSFCMFEPKEVLSFLTPVFSIIPHAHWVSKIFPFHIQDSSYYPHFHVFPVSELSLFCLFSTQNQDSTVNQVLSFYYSAKNSPVTLHSLGVKTNIVPRTYNSLCDPTLHLWPVLPLLLMLFSFLQMVHPIWNLSPSQNFLSLPCFSFLLSC